MVFKCTVYGQSLSAFVNAACLADNGNQILLIAEGFDPSQGDVLSNYPWIAAEPGLLALINLNIKAGRLVVSADIEKGVSQGYFQYLQLSANELPLAEKIAGVLGCVMTGDKVLVNRSLFPIGCSEKLQEQVFAQLNKRKAAYQCALVVEPDFRVEGRLIADFTRPTGLF